MIFNFPCMRSAHGGPGAVAASGDPVGTNTSNTAIANTAVNTIAIAGLAGPSPWVKVAHVTQLQGERLLPKVHVPKVHVPNVMTPPPRTARSMYKATGPVALKLNPPPERFDHRGQPMIGVPIPCPKRAAPTPRPTLSSYHLSHRLPAARQCCSPARPPDANGKERQQ